jgi:hypothetical protein
MPWYAHINRAGALPGDPTLLIVGPLPCAADTSCVRAELPPLGQHRRPNGRAQHVITLRQGPAPGFRKSK